MRIAGKNLCTSHPYGVSYTQYPTALSPPYALRCIATVRPHKSRSLFHKITATGCHTRFYYNYSVKSASKPDAVRIYHQPSMQKYIEITDHVYVDQDFCNWVRSEIAINT